MSFTSVFQIFFNTETLIQALYLFQEFYLMNWCGQIGSSGSRMIVIRGDGFTFRAFPFLEVPAILTILPPENPLLGWFFCRGCLLATYWSVGRWPSCCCLPLLVRLRRLWLPWTASFRNAARHNR